MAVGGVVALAEKTADDLLLNWTFPRYAEKRKEALEDCILILRENYFAQIASCVIAIGRQLEEGHNERATGQGRL